MDQKSVDYTLYLVTDSTPAILGDRDLTSVVEEAVKGGVTIVQLRDKTSDTGDLVRIAKALHNVTKLAGVPLLINDRVDVALAAAVEGVHIGQDDMDYKTARRLLGDEAIIGVTVNSVDEALVAAEQGADYLGVGTVYSTSTKQNVKSVIGTAGVQEVLKAISTSSNPAIKTVCIGGINASNIQRTLDESAHPNKSLDGVALVSAIIAASSPESASAHLKHLITSTPSRNPPPTTPIPTTTTSLLTRIPTLLRTLAESKPLCHNMTNLVVQNIAANIALAVGASPIMSNNSHEASDLAALGGSLVVNMGTTTPEMREHHLRAVTAYNAVGGPTVLDPVGAGATEERRKGVRKLLDGGHWDVIKGNEGEIRQVSGAVGVVQRGVDSGDVKLGLEERVKVVKEVAVKERCVVLMTGVMDVVSDGERVVVVKNGHELLGEITGSGCSLGTTIASMLAVGKEDKLCAVVAGLLMYEIAAERAAVRKDVLGPGTFVPAFIDELYRIRQETVAGSEDWLKAAKIEVL